MLGLISVLSFENWLYFAGSLYAEIFWIILNVVILCCLDSGFCYNPVENATLLFLQVINLVKFILQVLTLLLCVVNKSQFTSQSLFVLVWDCPTLRTETPKLFFRVFLSLLNFIISSLIIHPYPID